MKNLKEYILEARDNKVAIGHFNISNIEGLWAIFNSAKELNVPIVIGLSEGERKAVGTKQALAIVRSLQEEYDHPVFINADHCHSFEGFKEAVDAGYDMAIFDGASLSLEDNIEQTKRAVDYAKRQNPKILVEAELGYIGTSSAVLEDIPEGVSLDNLTKADDAKRFVLETCIDLFSPSVGNIHGMLKSAKNPKLNIERIKEIEEAIDIPMVLHGGSGISDEDFKEAIIAGFSMVHINTEIRKAWREGVEEGLRDNPNEVAPYKISKKAIENMQEVVERRLRLFNNI